MKKSNFKDSQIFGLIERAEAGEPVASLCREAGISATTFYKWRSKYGGMDVSMLARVKELEEENRRLKKERGDERADIHYNYDVAGAEPLAPIRLGNS